MARLIHRGAEAEVYEADAWGMPAVEKRRIEKSYRHPELDWRIRTSRTRLEARILMRLKEHGVRCPAVLDVWGDTLLLERVSGPTLLDLLSRGRREKEGEGLAGVMEDLGRQVGLMHSAGVVHNDLTPLNVVVTGGRTCLIDFGLGEFSRSEEDMAVDLHVLKKSLEALFPETAGELFERFLRGYRDTAPRPDATLARLEAVERRGRYRSWIG
ncbi:MAG: KEOPS complex kinase/ATPase Bud32 [Candidatus Korarchaeota archaeon]|nr:KEOPS complex kinase/ATPase Bud32 [Candidatus Korarchaeota archaeon]